MHVSLCSTSIVSWFITEVSSLDVNYQQIRERDLTVIVAAFFHFSPVIFLKIILLLKFVLCTLPFLGFLKPVSDHFASGSIMPVINTILLASHQVPGGLP